MLKEKDILIKLKKRFSNDEKRVKHCIGTAKMAEKLALKEGVSVKRARIAALLHDWAKSLSINKLYELVHQCKWEIDEVEMSIPCVLHAPVGAEQIKKELKINDLGVLRAIRYHTIGNTDLDTLGKIIFVADSIEPGRDYCGVENIRQKITSDLDSLVIAVCEHGIIYNINKKNIIHPSTLMMRNVLLEGKSNEKLCKRK